MASNNKELPIAFQTTSPVTLMPITMEISPCNNLAPCVAPSNVQSDVSITSGGSGTGNAGNTGLNDLMQYSDNTSSGLSATAIILIVLAAVLILLILVIFVAAYCHKKHKEKYPDSDLNNGNKETA